MKPITVTNFPLRYKALMKGNAIDFPENDVWEMLNYLDYYKINTLMVQANPEKTTNITRWFTCKVDEPTVKAYLKEQNSEMRIV